MITEEEMREHLNEGLCRVVFKKSNGEERDLILTRNHETLSEYLPQDASEEESPTEKKEDPKDVITAYSVEEHTWKRFKPSRVLRFDDNINFEEAIMEKMFDNTTILDNRYVDQMHETLEWLKDYVKSLDDTDEEVAKRVATAEMLVEYLNNLETINIDPEDFDKEE